jgi:hypothetical protein
VLAVEGYILRYLSALDRAAVYRRMPDRLTTFQSILLVGYGTAKLSGVGRYSTLPLWGASPLSLVSHMYIPGIVVPSGTH